MKLFFSATAVLLLVATGCRSYKENIMFSPGENFQNQLESQIWNLESDYQIQPFDRLNIAVVNKSGEMLIDPGFQSNTEGTTETSPNDLEYRVNGSGFIYMPMIDEVKVTDLNLTEAEALIKKKFLTKFDQPFVQVNFTNKRAYLLGSVGGTIIDLNHEGVSLIEAITLGGGIDVTGKADNIRIIRGEEVIVLDLSSIQGIKYANMEILPRDIIYIEPVRSPGAEGLREYSPVVGLISGVVSVLALIITITR